MSLEQYGQATRKTFMSSLVGLANTLAVAVAFFATPPVYGRTLGWVQSFTARNYGSGYEDFVSLSWFCICALVLFFAGRASISTGLVMLGIAMATRFL